MEPFLKIRISLLGVLLVMAGHSASAQTAADVVTPSDAQHFEQTYEDWAKNLIKSLDPKLEFTVLSNVEFSRNPQNLQAYDEMKAMNHLPGLPEMSDPNYASPLESPLYALVEKKTLKIIYYSQVSQQEMDLFREVMTAKMKLTAHDSLEFELVNRTPVVEAKVEPKASLHVSPSATATFALGIFLIVTAALSSRRHKAAELNAANAAKEAIAKSAGKKSAAKLNSKFGVKIAAKAALKAAATKPIAPYVNVANGASVTSAYAGSAHASSKVKITVHGSGAVATGAAPFGANDSSTTGPIPPQTDPTISSSHQIQTAPAASLRKVLADANIEIIGRACLHAKKGFSNRVLGECEEGKFDLAMQWIKKNHASVTAQQANYARLLIAARLQQAENDMILSSIEAFNNAREMKAKLKSQQSVFQVETPVEVKEAHV